MTRVRVRGLSRVDAKCTQRRLRLEGPCVAALAALHAGQRATRTSGARGGQEGRGKRGNE